MLLLRSRKMLLLLLLHGSLSRKKCSFEVQYNTCKDRTSMLTPRCSCKHSTPTFVGGIDLERPHLYGHSEVDADRVGAGWRWRALADDVGRGGAGGDRVGQAVSGGGGSASGRGKRREKEGGERWRRKACNTFLPQLVHS